MRPPQHRPWVIAHRGASRARAENTIAAFRHAVELGADAVELDVRRTADGVLVVRHDAALQDGRPIVSLTRAELLRRDPSIPGLEEALRACDGVWVNIEIKNSPVDPDWDPDDRVVTEVVDLVERSALLDRVLLSSFNPATIRRSLDISPTLPTALLVGRTADPLPFVAAAAAAGHRALHPSGSSLGGSKARALIAAAHQAELFVNVWTVDDPTEMRRLSDVGVDGIITNVPDVARSAFGEHGHSDGG